jgi:hypothetical protein
VTTTGRRLWRDAAILAAVLALALLPGALAGTAAGFALALFLPGFALLQCLRAPRHLDPILHLLDGGAASLALTPLALRLAGLMLPFDRRHVIFVLAGITAGLLLLASLRPRETGAPARHHAPGVHAILVATLLLLAPTLVIGPTADAGETRVKGWDLNNHLAIAESIASRGLPPVNPFIETGTPFYYHTFFHILVAAILVIAGPDAPAYLIISLVTLLLAGVFLATLYRVVGELTGDARIALFSLPLVSLVGGFDLIPMGGRLLLGKAGGGSPIRFFLRHWNVDGWVSNQGMLVPSFFASFYWVPHAVAAMTVFLLALLCLRKAETSLTALAVAATCLASMAGYNGYVALGGAATLALLGGADFVRFLATRFQSGRGVLLRSLLVGGLAILLALPILRLYAGGGGEIDKFRWVQPGPLLPLQILLEFGPALILGLAGLAALPRRHPDRDGLIPFLLMAVVSLLLLCCVASTGENNDLAMRISMFLWVGLAVFSGVSLNRLFPVSGTGAPGRRRGRIAALAVLALGFLSVAWFAIGAAVGKPTLPADMVQAGRWVRAHLPPGRWVQGSPLRRVPDLVYLTGHPAVLSDTWGGRLFYTAPEEFENRMSSLVEAFTTDDRAAACRTLRSLGIAALIVGPPERRDFRLLAAPEAWPCLSEAYANGTYRVYVPVAGDDPIRSISAPRP